MIKNVFFSLLMFVLAMGGYAQTTMPQVWKEMPDSITVYLNKDKRAMMVDLYHVDVLGNASNSLGGVSTIDSLDNRYCSVSMSSSMKMDMILLPKSEGDTLLCVVRTYKGPEPESVVNFYTLDWRRLEITDLLPEVRFEQLVEKPDSMNIEYFERLCSYFDPQLIEAVLDPADSSLTFHLSMPMLSEAEKKQLQAILVQRKLKWNGKTFK